MEHDLVLLERRVHRVGAGLVLVHVKAASVEEGRGKGLITRTNNEWCRWAPMEVKMWMRPGPLVAILT